MENFTLNQNVLLTLLTIPEIRQIFRQEFRQELISFFQEPSSISLNHNSEVWFDIDGLCNYHPTKPAKQTVYTWVSNKTIPFHKKGKKLFFLKSEIDEFLKSGRNKTVNEISAGAVSSLGKKIKG